MSKMLDFFIFDEPLEPEPKYFLLVFLVKVDALLELGDKCVSICVK